MNKNIEKIEKNRLPNSGGLFGMQPSQKTVQSFRNMIDF